MTNWHGVPDGVIWEKPTQPQGEASMTTFTLQDLTPEQQVAVTNHEEMHKMFQAMNPATTQDVINNMAIPNPDAIQYTHGGTLGAPEPQPTPTGTDVPDLWIVVNNLGAQLQLLATVIKEKQGNSLNVEDQSKSLQECVSLTLQQADWFKDMIRHELIGGGIEDLAKDAVQDIVESEVESYFENNFDPSYHFDFDDAVSDAVDDRIDGIVSDKIDDAVEGYMSNATITISK
jgi:hypothetical protein